MPHKNIIRAGSAPVKKRFFFSLLPQVLLWLNSVDYTDFGLKRGIGCDIVRSKNRKLQEILYDVLFK